MNPGSRDREPPPDTTDAPGGFPGASSFRERTREGMPQTDANAATAL